MVTPTAAPAPTDYERELNRVDRDIAELSAAPRDDVEAGTKLAYRYYQRASLTGIGFAVAERVADDALRRFGPAQDLCLLRATLHSRFHRVAPARRELARSPGLSTTLLGRLLTADL